MINEVLEDIGSVAPGDFIQEVVGKEGDDLDGDVGRVHVRVRNSKGGVMVWIVKQHKGLPSFAGCKIGSFPTIP